MNKSIFNGPLCGTWQKTASLILQTGLGKPEGFAESHRKNVAQTAKEQMSLYYQFFTSTSCSQTFKLQGTLFSGFCIAVLTAEPGYLLPPHCVNDIHWCNIVFPWKGKLIIVSYRACDDPMPGNVECLGGVQDVLELVHWERSLCGKWCLEALETHSLPPPPLQKATKSLPRGAEPAAPHFSVSLLLFTELNNLWFHRWTTASQNFSLIFVCIVLILHIMVHLHHGTLHL